MYKELRTHGSTGTAWAKPFLAADAAFLDRLKAMSLHTDARWHAIRTRVPRGATVLDAGCGMGQWCAFLTRRGYRTIGLDFSSEIIQTLEQRFPNMRWQSGRIQEMPFPDKSVDAIISWGVIEHDEDGPQRALAEYRRVLRDGGIAFLTIPIDSPAQRAASAACFDGPESREFFQYFFTPEEFAAEVECAGFRLVEPVRAVSRHHAIAYPNLVRRIARLRPWTRRAAGWILKPTLALVPASVNMVLAVARR